MFRHTLFALVLAAAAVLAGCGNRNPERPAPAGNEAPTVVLEEPATALVATAGDAVRIVYRDDDPDSSATTTILADLDGDLATTVDQTVIGANRPEADGAVQEIFWNTAGARAGTYRIAAITSDGALSASALATGTVEILLPAPGTVMELLSSHFDATEGGGHPYNVRIESWPDGSYLLSGAYTGALTLGLDQPNETTLAGAPAVISHFRARFAADHSLLFAHGAVLDLGIAPIVRPLPGSRTLVVLVESVGGALSARFEIYDAAGAEVTSRTESGYFSVGAAAVFPDGGFLLEGVAYDRVVLDPGGPDELAVDAGTLDTHELLVRYDPTGQPLWARLARGDLSGNAHLVAFDDGAFALYGISDGITLGVGEANETSFPIDTGALARFTADGSLQWGRTISSIEDVQVTEAGVFDDGSLVLGGSFATQVVFSEGATDEREVLASDYPGDRWEVFLARYAEDGSLAWARREGALRDESGIGLATFSDGTTVMLIDYRADEMVPTVFGAGEPGERSTHPAVEAGRFLARFTADGILQESRLDMDGLTSGVAGDVAPLPDGSFLLATLITGTTTIGQGDARETTLTYPAGATEGETQGPVVAHYAR